MPLRLPSRRSALAYIRRRPLRSVIIVLLLVLLSFGSRSAMTITDPSDPRFDPNEFRFEDYQANQDDLPNTFRVLFPIGTNRTTVEAILVRAGGARAYEDRNRQHEVHYIYGPNATTLLQTNHTVIYDDHEQLLNILPHGDPLYPHQPRFGKEITRE